MLSGLIRFRKVEDVTAPKDEPAPVYLLDELVQASQTSPEDAQHIVEHLVKKLDSKNPVVKAKSLRACKYLAQKGARDAHRILQRNAAPVRQLQSYKGVVDPLKGDALNERVRTLAKEAVAAIFSAETPVTHSSTPQSRIQGFGSHSAPPPMGSTVTMSSKMVGFGNEMYQRTVNERRYSTASTRTTSQPSAAFTTSRQTMSFLNEQTKVEAENGQSAAQNNGGHGSVLGDEEELVDSICQPGGVRSAPAKEDLRRFIDTAGSLNGPKIAVKLQKKLESPNWQEAFRALCAIEMVILQGSSVSCGEIGVHFQGDLDIIRRCLKSPQRSVRDRAQNILNIFVEVEDVEEKAPSEETPPLIDGVVEEAPINPPSVLDLLDDDVGGMAEAPAKSESEMFQGLEVVADATAPSASGSQVSDMFSGLAVSDVSTPAKGKNDHLAALLAPSPAADPFPETMTPLKAEISESPPQPVAPNPVSYSMPMPGMVQSYGPPQGPVVNGTFMGQMPMMAPPQPGGVQYMNVPTMQPNMNPGGFGAPPFMPPYGSYMQQVPPYQSQGSAEGNRGEVPLAAFMGPAHIERRNSSGGGNKAFSFVGDHISQLRDKK